MPNVGFENFPLFSVFATESIDIDAAAEALPDHGPGMYFLRAHPDNTGTVTLGSSSSVTDGAGYTMAAGDVVGPLALNNLNLVYAIGSAANQVLEVLKQS